MSLMVPLCRGLSGQWRSRGLGPGAEERLKLLLGLREPQHSSGGLLCPGSPEEHTEWAAIPSSQGSFLTGGIELHLCISCRVQVDSFPESSFLGTAIRDYKRYTSFEIFSAAGPKAWPLLPEALPLPPDSVPGRVLKPAGDGITMAGMIFLSSSTSHSQRPLQRHFIGMFRQCSHLARASCSVVMRRIFCLVAS